MIFETQRINKHPNYIRLQLQLLPKLEYLYQLWRVLFPTASPPVAIAFTNVDCVEHAPTAPENFHDEDEIRSHDNTEENGKLIILRVRCIHCSPFTVHSTANRRTNINYLRHAIHFINYKCHHGMTSRFDVPMCVSFEKKTISGTCAQPIATTAPPPSPLSMCVLAAFRFTDNNNNVTYSVKVLCLRVSETTATISIGFRFASQ